MKEVLIETTEDAKVQGYGMFDAGLYVVEMPDDYDPTLVTAEDIILDESMHIVGQDEYPHPNDADGWDRLRDRMGCPGR